MIYLALLTLILVLASLIGTLIYAYKKLRRSSFLLLIASLLLMPTVLWKHYEQEFILQAVPDALEVQTVSYRNEESWGFGPGGNEAGIRFYPLSEDVSRRVGIDGLQYFENLRPSNGEQSRNLRGHYEQWSETPIQGEPWQINPDTGLLDVTDYICAYGFCIDIPADRLNQVNEIISRPGSFYAHDGTGIIVVSPTQKLVLYFYNG